MSQQTWQEAARTIQKARVCFGSLADPPGSHKAPGEQNNSVGDILRTISHSCSAPKQAGQGQQAFGAGVGQLAQALAGQAWEFSPICMPLPQGCRRAHIYNPAFSTGQQVPAPGSHYIIQPLGGVSRLTSLHPLGQALRRGLCLAPAHLHHPQIHSSKIRPNQPPVKHYRNFLF